MGASRHRLLPAIAIARAPLARRVGRTFIALCVAWLLWAPSIASAEEAPEDAVAKQPVSTSPLARRADRENPSAARQASHPVERPLTRAAARRQIESVTPVPWLARYGQVDIAPRE